MNDLSGVMIAVFMGAENLIGRFVKIAVSRNGTGRIRIQNDGITTGCDAETGVTIVCDFHVWCSFQGDCCAVGKRKNTKGTGNGLTLIRCENASADPAGRDDQTLRLRFQLPG